MRSVILWKEPLVSIFVAMAIHSLTPRNSHELWGAAFLAMCCSTSRGMRCFWGKTASLSWQGTRPQLITTIYALMWLTFCETSCTILANSIRKAKDQLTGQTGKEFGALIQTALLCFGAPLLSSAPMPPNWKTGKEGLLAAILSSNLHKVSKSSFSNPLHLHFLP